MALFILLVGLPITRAQEDIDAALIPLLHQAGFTGNIQATLASRLGRNIDPRLANLGRLLCFDDVSTFVG